MRDGFASPGGQPGSQVRGCRAGRAARQPPWSLCPHTLVHGQMAEFSPGGRVLTAEFSPGVGGSCFALPGSDFSRGLHLQGLPSPWEESENNRGMNSRIPQVAKGTT